MTVRVLVNALHAKSGGGTTYLRNMLPLLAGDPELEIHVAASADQGERFAGDGIAVHAVFAGGGMIATALAEQLKLPGLARRIGADVVYSPANYGPLRLANQVLLLRNAPSVIEIEKRPDKILYWRAVKWLTVTSLKRARRAIAVSDYARRLFVEMVPDAAGKIDVVPHGVAATFQPPAPGEAREGFLLAVSDIYVQKNFEVLLRALARLKEARPGLTLRIAGRPIDRGYFESLQALAAQLGVTDRVQFLGGVEPDELGRLYRRCAVFVFPSTVETFGNPLLEAMASGCAVVSSNAAAMPEIAGDAALYFDPRDDAVLAETVGRLLDDPDAAGRMGETARQRAAGFGWPETARRTADILKSCAGK